MIHRWGICRKIYPIYFYDYEIVVALKTKKEGTQMKTILFPKEKVIKGRMDAIYVQLEKRMAELVVSEVVMLHEYLITPKWWLYSRIKLQVKIYRCKRFIRKLEEYMKNLCWLSAAMGYSEEKERK